MQLGSEGVRTRGRETAGRLLPQSEWAGMVTLTAVGVVGEEGRTQSRKTLRKENQ